MRGGRGSGSVSSPLTSGGSQFEPLTANLRDSGIRPQEATGFEPVATVAYLAEIVLVGGACLVGVEGCERRVSVRRRQSSDAFAVVRDRDWLVGRPPRLNWLIDAGGTEREPVIDVGDSIRVATVTDPSGNIIGIIENPHFALPEGAASTGPGR